ncbi:MAG: NUDIX hydrolase [Candidatus Kerfeldbacteria bacterium]|nr:NUDIX hydrolase [Candidatus Kerfeldbacteria bacterium]
MNTKCKYQITVGGILLKQGEVLLLQRAASESILPNLWELPSGKKEAGESISQVLLREFKEETGLKVKIVKPISVFDYQLVKAKQIICVTQINFLVKHTGRRLKIRLSEEHRAYQWAGKHDLKRLRASKEIDQILNSVL